MENFDEMDEAVMLSPQGKRKRRQPKNSARAMAKSARHSGNDIVPRVSCRHITMHFVKRVH